MKNLVHRLADPRDPSYPFTDTYICSNCNERLSINDTKCNVCELYIYGMVNKETTVKQVRKNNVSPNYSTILKTNKNKTKESNTQINIESNLNEEASSLFRQSILLIIILGTLLAMLIAYDLNQNIVKTRNNYSEINN